MLSYKKLRDYLLSVNVNKTTLTVREAMEKFNTCWLTSGKDVSHPSVSKHHKFLYIYPKYHRIDRDITEAYVQM